MSSGSGGLPELPGELALFARHRGRMLDGLASAINRKPPPALSHSGRGSPDSLAKNLSPPSPPAPILAPPRPRGAAIRRYAVGGAGAAPAGGVTTHSREASGHRPGDTSIPVRGARWNGRPVPGSSCVQRTRQRRSGIVPWRRIVPNWLPPAGPMPWQARPDKRGQVVKIAGRRAPTGRADGGSIHPRRILAQWKRPDTPRLAALRCPSPINERGNAGGEDACADPPSCSPLWRAPTSGAPHAIDRDVDGRDRPDHDEAKGSATLLLNPRPSSSRRRSPSSSGWRRRGPDPAPPQWRNARSSGGLRS